MHANPPCLPWPARPPCLLPGCAWSTPPAPPVSRSPWVWPAWTERMAQKSERQLTCYNQRHKDHTKCVRVEGAVLITMNAQDKLDNKGPMIFFSPEQNNNNMYPHLHSVTQSVSSPSSHKHTKTHTRPYSWSTGAGARGTHLGEQRQDSDSSVASNHGHIHVGHIQALHLSIESLGTDL